LPLAKWLTGGKQDAAPAERSRGDRAALTNAPRVTMN
jgi:hypothetical protein